MAIDKGRCVAAEEHRCTHQVLHLAPALGGCAPNQPTTEGGVIDQGLGEFGFEIAGANLADDIKEKVKKINEEMATLSTQYSSKLLISRKNATVYFDSEAQLEGLSKEEIAAAQEKANKEGKTGKYAIGIINTTQQPVLQTMKNRASREKVFKASWTRAEKNDDESHLFVTWSYFWDAIFLEKNRCPNK